MPVLLLTCDCNEQHTPKYAISDGQGLPPLIALLFWWQPLLEHPQLSPYTRTELIQPPKALCNCTIFVLTYQHQQLNGDWPGERTGESLDTGGKHLSALKMINPLQHEPKLHLWPPALTLIHFPDCSRFQGLPDFGIISALLQLSICSRAKGSGLFRQAPVPAESPILKFKPRVYFFFLLTLRKTTCIFHQWFYSLVLGRSSNTAAVCLLSKHIYYVLL